MILQFLFLSLSIFVKYNSTDTDCTKSFPCNYTYAISKIKDNEKIYIFDEKMQEAQQLADFHFFIQNISDLLLNKIEINGNNTIVDGSYFPRLFPSFLFINKVQIDFSNFIFHDFQTTVVYYRDSNNSSLSNILFDSNCLTDQISLFSSTFSTLALNNVTFQNSWQYRSSFIFSSSSKLFFNNCKFDNIPMTTIGESFLFMFIDSEVEFQESNLTNLNFMSASLFLITSQSTLKLNKVFIKNNIFNEMFAVTRKSNVFITSCKLIENKGTILTSLERSNVTFINSILESNVATGRELFLVKKSNIIINYDCQFTKNVADTFMKLKGKNGFANISYCDFVSNIATESFISVWSQSIICMTKCMFKSNNANDQLILLSNQATGSLNEIEFYEVRSTVFKLNLFSSLNCSNSAFLGLKFISNSLISVKKSSSLTVKSSQFNIQSINKPLIKCKISSKISAVNCIFDGSLDESFSNDYQCINCTFRRPNSNKKHGFFSSISYYKAFYVLMSSFAVFEAGKLIFSCMIYFNGN